MMLVYVVPSTTSTRRRRRSASQPEDREWRIREAQAVDLGGNRVRILEHGEPAQG